MQGLNLIIWRAQTQTLPLGEHPLSPLKEVFVTLTITSRSTLLFSTQLSVVLMLVTPISGRKQAVMLLVIKHASTMSPIIQLPLRMPTGS